MITFPNCKINLGLNILSCREDGFHDLETFFFPINIYDALEVLPSKEIKTRLTVSGIATGEIENNICLKAYSIIKKDYPQLPEIKIHLHKAIPLGAGLGGGSADGVSTLQLINEKFRLQIPKEQLFNYALKLGSDCPFFLYNLPCFASGRGEILEPSALTLSGFKMIIINPGIHISTAEAFSGITPKTPVKNIKEIISQPIDTWKKELTNDFEKTVFEKYPLLKKIKTELYKSGAIYASMSGSGSTLFGIFKNNFIANHLTTSDYFYKILEIA